jgi:hypothetical protein
MVQPPLAFKTADLRIRINSRSLFAKRHGLLLGKPHYLKQQASEKRKNSKTTRFEKKEYEDEKRKR